MKLEDYNEYYIQGSDHYLIPKEVLEELFNEMVNWREESIGLKKQLEKEKNKYIKRCEELFAEGIDVEPEELYIAELEQRAMDCELMEMQQKKFIKYLKNKINKIKEQIKNYDIWHEVGTDINFLILKKQFYIEILQKYKEIIGDNNEYRL